MPTFNTTKLKNCNNMYWCNAGAKIVLAELRNAEIGLFTLWSNSSMFQNDPSWTASKHKPGWYWKEEYAKNLIFF